MSVVETKKVVTAVTTGVVINALLHAGTILGSWQVFSYRLEQLEAKMAVVGQLSDRVLRLESRHEGEDVRGKLSSNSK